MDYELEYLKGGLRPLKKIMFLSHHLGPEEELDNMELEDVHEEVLEEIDSKSSQHLSNIKKTSVPSPKLTRKQTRGSIRPQTPGQSRLPDTSKPTARPKWQFSTRIKSQIKVTENDNQRTKPEHPKVQSPGPRRPSPPAKTPEPEPKQETRPKTPSISPTVPPALPIPSKPIRKTPTPVNPVTPDLRVSPVLPVSPVVPINAGHGEPIPQQTAIDLRKIVFGTALSSFNSDWRTQHINFLKHSSYGISFYKPGPCGLIACIQAYLMKYLLFCQQLSIMTESVLEPLPSERQQALVSAMANILWQAAEKESKCAIVCLPGPESKKLTSKKEYRKDGLTENLVLFGFDDLKELEKFIKRHLSFFENTSGNGCVVFLYSVILSRSIKGVIKDLGNPALCLMSSNDTCSQAMINLLLTGRAVKQTFNGDMAYDSKGKSLPFPLKGINTRSDIGFLTINEHFRPKEFQVGSMLKTPKYPIWVVDSTGGRYSVIFCLNSELVNDWRLERRFSLNYYNGTTKYSSSLDDIITVDTRDFVDDSEMFAQDVHPVEHCIRTKWPGAVIEWH